MGGWGEGRSPFLLISEFCLVVKCLEVTGVWRVCEMMKGLGVTVGGCVVGFVAAATSEKRKKNYAQEFALYGSPLTGSKGNMMRFDDDVPKDGLVCYLAYSG